jgi:hypothetical protein
MMTSLKERERYVSNLLMISNALGTFISTQNAEQALTNLQILPNRSLEVALTLSSG